jgi:hypothetical protein
MRQLQLFTSSALAQMRDRSASRNYSPQRDEFRREHERHRTWGLTQRHGERLRRLRNGSCASRSGGHQDPLPAPVSASTPLEQEQCTARSSASTRSTRVASTRGRNAPTSRRSSRGSGTSGSAPAPAGSGQPVHVGHGDSDDHAEPARRPAPAPASSLLVPASGSGRSAHAIRPTPRPPQHNYRLPLKTPADNTIGIGLKLTIRHPAISRRRPEKPRAGPQSRALGRVLIAHWPVTGETFASKRSDGRLLGASMPTSEYPTRPREHHQSTRCERCSQRKGWEHVVVGLPGLCPPMGWTRGQQPGRRSMR